MARVAKKGDSDLLDSSPNYACDDAMIGVVGRLSHYLLDDSVVCSPEGVDLSEANLAVGATEGLKLWGGVTTYLEGSGIKVHHSSRVCCTCDPSIIISGHLSNPWIVFLFWRCEWDLVFEGLDARPAKLLLAMQGHIETFSMMPQQLYQLFDAPIGFGPFSSGYCREATFVTRMGDFCANLIRSQSSDFQSVMTKLSERNVWDFGSVSSLLTWSVAEALCECRSRPCLVDPVEGAPWRIGVLEVECVLPRGLLLHDVGGGPLRWWAFAVVKARFATRFRSISMETLASMLNAVRTRTWTLVGACKHAFGSRGLGVSTFPGMRDGHV
ncbi:hypothetical protein CRG98_006376 [Punica granatum]|uniref:Uncharacterized protein n=1 Tax=Punica granatum TaxID=22663 RepID=A0A2I0KXP2_PUNGR|nr:hypothetical protein CRG98_006376 [Punica granatum]